MAFLTDYIMTSRKQPLTFRYSRIAVGLYSSAVQNQKRVDEATF